MGLFRRMTSSRHLPVLMVRGFGEMAPLPHVMEDYRRDGFVVELMPADASNSVDVVAHALAVARHGRDLSGRHRQSRINLVGFSLGGLACLYALNRLALDQITGIFVSYGTPYQGTTIAALAVLSPFTSDISAQCTPGSPFLQELREETQFSDVPRVSIGGTRDMICPIPTTYLPHARNVRVDRAHAGFLLSRKVHRVIRSHLK